MPTFDVVSTVDLQEVKNAVDQARREMSTRYDFRGSKASVELKEEAEIEILAEDDMRLTAVQEILRQKLSKRGVSLKSVTFEEPEKAGGDMKRQKVVVKQGLSADELKKINKMLKEQKFKVSAQIQGDQLRVSGKKRDELQEVIGFLRAEVSELDLQFVNFRD